MVPQSEFTYARRLKGLMEAAIAIEESRNVAAKDFIEACKERLFMEPREIVVYAAREGLCKADMERIGRILFPSYSEHQTNEVVQQMLRQEAEK